MSTDHNRVTVIDESHQEHLPALLGRYELARIAWVAARCEVPDGVETREAREERATFNEVHGPDRVAQLGAMRALATSVADRLFHRFPTAARDAVEVAIRDCGPEMCDIVVAMARAQFVSAD